MKVRVIANGKGRLGAMGKHCAYCSCGWDSPTCWGYQAAMNHAIEHCKETGHHIERNHDE